MAKNNLITVYSKYVDLASPEVTKSFGAIKNESKSLAKEFDSLKRSISASMGYFRKDIKAAMEDSIKQQQKHSTETARHARTAGFEIGKLTGKIGSMRNIILVYFFMLRQFIDSLKDVTKAAIEQEDAIKRINTAMGIQGTYSKEMSDRLINLSTSFQSVTRYADEAVLAVMEELITIGKIMPSQLERATKATLDFASVTGKDLPTAATIMAKASAGNVSQLARYGIIVDKNISSSKKFDSALSAIEKRMGGRAQADIESYGGKVTQLSNSFGEFKEAFGNWLIQFLKLEKVVPILKGFFEKTTEYITVPTKEIKKLKLELEKVENEIFIFNATELSKKKASFFGDTQESIDYSKNLLIQREELKTKIAKTGAEERTKQEIIDIKISEQAITQEKLKIQQDFEEKYSTFQNQKASYRLSELEKEYATYKSAYEGNAQELLEVDTWYKQERKNLELDLVRETKKYGDMQVEIALGIAAGMKSAFSDGFFKLITGEVVTLQEVFADFGMSVLRTLSDVIAKLAVKSAFESAASATSWSWLSAVALAAHTGGYMYGSDSSYGYSPRKKYHRGGEVDATLLEGEGVVNQRGMSNLGVDNLNRLNRGESVGGGGTTINNFYIQAIDIKSFRDMLQQNGDIFAAASGADIRNNGALRKTSMAYGG